ncbi:MAG: ferritin family protein [Candidatus Cloacimonadota bacterium]|nr:ferritin family protein [Candidatus Cloacimonadota bacterium]
MKNKSMNEILEFAIDRERDAVSFYQKLQKMVRFDNQIKMLKDLEDMEKGHITLLQNIKRKEDVDFILKDVQDLKLSDYLIEKEPSPEMDYQDILIIAMKREEASTNLYKGLAQAVTNNELKKLFKRLAQEEAEHKFRFENIYDEFVLTDN